MTVPINVTPVTEMMPIGQYTGFFFSPYFFNYFIIVQLQLSAFSPHHSPQPQPNPPPSLASTIPLGFVHMSFIVVPENPSPHCLLPALLGLLDCS